MWSIIKTPYISLIILMTLYPLNIESKHLPFDSLKNNRIPKESVILEIIQQNNEILDEKAELTELGLIDTFPNSERQNSKVSKSYLEKKRLSKKIKLPAYLDFLDEVEELENLNNFNYLEQTHGTRSEDRFANLQNPSSSGPLARVWLPLEIRDADKGPRALVLFQQTKSKSSLGPFVQAEIILTRNLLMPDLEGVSIRLVNDDQYQTGDARISQKVSRNERFYSFDITEYIRNKLGDELVVQHPQEIRVLFELMYSKKSHSDTGDLHFYQIFDAQVGRPFIIFNYKDHHHHQVQISRNRRSVSGVSGLGDLDLPEVSYSITENLNETTITTNSSTNSSATATTEVLEQPTLMPSPSSVPAQPSVLPVHLCQRVTWEVDPDDIDWFDMIRPRRVELGYCAGVCPFPLQNDQFNFTLHSFFVDRHRLNKVFDIPKNFPHACCVPISYKSMTVWIVEEENSIVRKVVDDVSVDQCGCR